MAIDKKFFNIIQLGIGFMLVFTAFQTMGNVEKLILHGVKDFTGNEAFFSLAIIYGVFAVCNWFVPSFIVLTGPRVAIVAGSITYAIYIGSFLWPKAWLLYLASAFVGLGAALLWTGQGNFLALNSTKDTISKHSGIFWALFQASMFIGNTFVYFQFRGKDEIDSDTRFTVITTLVSVAIVGIVVLFILRKAPRRDDSELDIAEQKGPVRALKDALALCSRSEMLLLCLTFLYTGFVLSFYSAVYGACIGFTKEFGDKSNQYAALSGILIGAGEVIGGLLFGIFSSKTNKWGRDPIIIGGYIVHTVAFFLIFLNLPNDSPINVTNDLGFITPSPALALLGSFMLGFGDSCVNTQLYATLGDLFSDCSAEAFAVFKFTQSVSAAAALAYANVLQLYYQLVILVIFATLSTVAYVRVEIMNRRKMRDSAESI
ncbi:UNC93-like protein MFSD11 [Chrysoperla carnea]|uniref:UNC93-like protein MFSD11 n=1 Tax=Chrysoperla carnea TaxID=189513 RepID=UPI001D0952C1|nr:UNC93-like protein MFSD11 [Chrysoperla carnea]